MKRILLVLVLPFFCFISSAQLGSTIYVNGKNILGPCGDTLTLRGVNYAPYNWGWSPTQLRISNIAQSGANCVRLVWYKNPASGTPTTVYTNLTYLDSALSKCIQNNMIPIVDLHDLTCTNVPANLTTLATWFIAPGVKSLINKYKHSIILNIANECLYVSWASNPTTAQSTFVSTYSAIVNSIRSNGITVPIMIDAPDCGQSIDVLTAIGPTLQTADPNHNLIFSAHAYWYAYATNDSLKLLTKINNALAANIPLVLGEIANTQDDAQMCQYALNYKALLNICKAKKVGWLAWSWDNDGCASRQITTAGSVTSLTTYGQEILNNSGFGLLTNPPSKSMYLEHDACKISIRAFHEGLYNSVDHKMNTALLNSGIGTSTLLADSITLHLKANTSPYQTIYSKKLAWQTNGWMDDWLPLGITGTNSFYALCHRNGLETWSSSAQQVRTTLRYDFTSNANKAMGNNQIYLENGVYGMYSGDVNQDDVIDVFDYLLMEPDIVNGNFGYLASDINGDGVVDIFDYILIEINIILGQGAWHL